MSPRQRKLTQIRARRLQLEQSNRPKPKDWTGVIVIAIIMIITIGIFLDSYVGNEQTKRIFEGYKKTLEMGGMERRDDALRYSTY